MSIPTEGKLLRIFIGEADHWHGKPLYEAIVVEARKRGLAGATVIKGFMGFGAHSRIHTAKLLELSQDLPIVVEIVFPVVDRLAERKYIVRYRDDRLGNDTIQLTPDGLKLLAA